MRKFLFFLLPCLISTMVYAKRDTVSSKSSGTSIINGLILSAAGSRYINPLPANKNFWVERSIGLVKLSNPLSVSGVRPIGQASVTVSIQYQVMNSNGSTFDLKDTTATLQLDLNSSTAKNIAYFKGEGAQQIQATVTAVSVTGLPDIELEVSVITDGFDFLEVNTPLTLSHDGTLTSDGNLKINWSAVTAADHYELEWTYVSNHGDDPAVSLTPAQIEVDPFLLRNNSSRVESAGLSYQIPMIYEKGIIVYRLRAVGKNIVNSMPVFIKTQWTSPDGLYSNLGAYPSANLYTFNGLEENINWQSSLNFAEEGKHKVILNYHDGSLRSRQTVMRINSDQRSVVGETLYDYNGRPMIQILPTPVTVNSLSYFPNFNVVEGKTQINKADYDNSEEGKSCKTPIAPLMSTTTGASQYYSTNNQFGSNGNTGNNLLDKALIPDAQKYPYIQTLYTPDNSGRIAVESGVGLTHRIGNNKETKHFYSVPQQPELTRLFGNQVGFVGHYKKDVTIDPNGQATVKYTDLNNKIIATGLAGNKPSNLNYAGDTASRSVKTDLLASGTSNQVTTDGLAKIYSSKLTVTGANTPYTFNYTGQIGKFDITCLLNQSSNPLNYSIDGAVDVEVILQDNCNTPLFDINQSTSKGNTGNIQNVTLPQKEVTLQPGEYQITKTLKIKEEVLEQYWQEYLAKTGVCILTEADFRNEELKKINTSGCGITCDRCNQMIDSIINTSTNLTPENEETLRSACNGVCDNREVACRSALDAMRGDLSPGGQYAQLRKERISQASAPQVSLDPNNQPQETDFDITVPSNVADPQDDPVDPSSFFVSIFKEDNNLRVPRFLSGVTSNFTEGLKATWRHPLQINNSSFSGDNWKNQALFQDTVDLRFAFTYQETEYKDAKGDVFYVNIYAADSNGTTIYTPRIIAPSVLVPIDASSGLYKIPARYLERLADFEKLWQPHWANYFLPYHPEYEYYLECTSHHISHAFDYSAINAATIIQAKQLGYVNNNNDPAIIGADAAGSLDPFLKENTGFFTYMSGLNQIYKSQTSGGTTVKRSMAQIATMTVGCPTGQTNCTSNCEDGKIDTDQEWQIYRSLYLSEKQKLLRNQALHRAVDGFFYNGCIGQKNYSEFVLSGEDEYFRRPIDQITPFNAIDHQCYKSWLDPFNFFTTCVDVSYTAFFHATTYPYLNRAELCYIERAPDYENKTQRFYPRPPQNTTGQPAQNCTTFATDNSVNPPKQIQIDIPCDQDIQDATQVAIEEAQRFKYESCGLCPMASDVESLLRDLVKNNVLVPSQDLLLTCYKASDPVKLGDVLRRELLLLNSSNPQIFWSATTSLGGKRLDGKLFTGSTVMATISLRIPDNVPATFQTLPKVCCLSVVTSGLSTFFTFENGKIFNLESSFIDQNQEKDFTIEGKISIAIAPCSIPPRCAATDGANRVEAFLNLLCTTTTTGKVHELNTNNSNVSMTQVSNIDFYRYAVRVILKRDNRNVINGYLDDITTVAPAWKSFVVNDVLTGTFSYTDNGTNKNILIEISGLPSGQQYENVVEFINPRPESIDMQSNDPCINSSCTKQTFKADAVVVSNGQRSVFPVSIFVPDPSLVPVACMPAVAPSN